MINLAGNDKSDLYIAQELCKAGIEQVYTERYGEVNATIQGRFLHYKLTRAWTYWVVLGHTSLRISNIIYKESKNLEKGNYGFPMRVDGNCGCPAPEGSVRGWHIDTQEGLNKFIELVNKHS